MVSFVFKLTQILNSIVFRFKVVLNYIYFRLYLHYEIVADCRIYLYTRSVIFLARYFTIFTIYRLLDIHLY